LQIYPTPFSGMRKEREKAREADTIRGKKEWGWGLEIN
jgi:hypothetical protein